jgi:exopolysaccharide production protein ExoZ
MQVKITSEKFHSIQALRGIAAIMVVVYHATALWGLDFGDGHSAWNVGQAGVPIFFVISGFVMAKSDQSISAVEFMKRRIIRIVPLYWAITAIMLLKLMVVRAHPALGSNTEHIRIPFSYIVSSFLFMPFRNSLGAIQPILSVGWTLSFELFFYCLFAVALALKVNIFRFLAATIIPLSIVGSFYNETWPAFSSLFRPMLLNFLSGVAIAYAIRKGFSIPTYASLALGLFSVIGIATNHAFGASAAMIVLAAVMLENKISIPAWMLRTGDASYSIYLVHPLALLFVARMFLWLQIPSESAMVALGVSASIIAGLFSYYLLEKRFALRINRFILPLYSRKLYAHASFTL